MWMSNGVQEAKEQIGEERLTERNTAINRGKIL